ncbi:MAG: helix-turn-helix domain-containing protein [Streptosporangiaceae bacterium]
MVTNSCLHSNSRQPGGHFTVRIQLHGPCLRVEVSDQGGPWTTPATDDHGNYGRGLHIVGQLAHTWGRTGNTHIGWTTWFEINSPPGLPSGQPATKASSCQRWIAVLDGHQLRHLRRQQGLSQEQLAAKAGVSQSTVARLEPPPHITCRSRTLARLAAALGEPTAALNPGQPPITTPTPVAGSSASSAQRASPYSAAPAKFPDVWELGRFR